MNNEQLLTIADDIEYLAEKWRGGRSDRELRHGSAILRRFLIDGDGVLARAWRCVGNEKQPKVFALDLDMFLTSLGPINVLFAFAGGTTRIVPGWGSFLDKGPTAVSFTWDDAKEDTINSITVHTQMRRRLVGDKQAEKVEAIGTEMPISRFLNGTCAYARDLEKAQELRVTRRELIQYFANYRGGVHLGAVTKATLRKIVAKVERLRKKRIKDDLQDELTLEILAIGQSIARSPDLKQLAAQIRIKVYQRERRRSPDTLTEKLSMAYASLGSSFLERCATANTAAFGRNVRIARVKFSTAVRPNPANAYAYYLWAMSLAWSAGRAKKQGRLRLLRLAEAKYRLAVKANPSYFQAYNNLGNVLSDQAKLMDADNAFELYGEAEAQYESALKAYPRHAEALYNWCICLLRRAYLSPTDDADRYYEKAKRKCDAALELKPSMYQAYEAWAHASTERAKILPVDEREQHLSEAEKYANVAIRIRSDYEKAHYTLGKIHALRATMRGSKVEESRLVKAEKEYKIAVEINSNYTEALVAWASSLIQRATDMEDKAAKKLFHAAQGKLEAALRIDSSCSDALFTFGWMLEAEARRATGIQSDKSFDKAIDYYRRTTSLNPRYSAAYYRWANIIIERSATVKGSEKAKLLREAAEKYDMVLAHIRHDAVAWYRSGWTLSNLAILLGENGEDSLLLDARVRLEKAIELSPDLCDARVILGNTLIELGKRRGTTAKSLFRKAEEAFLEAEQLHKGRASFYLGCLCALTSRNDECRRWLFNSMEHGQVAKETLQEEKDLGAVRGLQWFDDLLAECNGDRSALPR